MLYTVVYCRPPSRLYSLLRFRSTERSASIVNKRTNLGCRPFRVKFRDSLVPGAKQTWCCPGCRQRCDFSDRHSISCASFGSPGLATSEPSIDNRRNRSHLLHRVTFLNPSPPTTVTTPALPIYSPSDGSKVSWSAGFADNGRISSLAAPREASATPEIPNSTV